MRLQESTEWMCPRFGAGYRVIERRARMLCGVVAGLTPLPRRSTDVRRRFSHANTARAYVRAVIGRQKAKEMLMACQLEFSGRTGRRALLAMLAAVFVVSFAVPAANATLVVTPQIAGSGEIRTNGAPALFCDQGVLLNTTVKVCPAPPQLLTDCSIFFCVTNTVTLAPTPKSGWRFDHWDGCGAVSGSTCSMSASIFGLGIFTPTAFFREIVDTALVSGPP